MIGWSVHSAATLPVYFLFGFSPFVVAGIGGVCILVAGFSLSQPSSPSETELALTIPVWAFAAAAILALFPATTLLPKTSGDAVRLADATFDHSKSAIIDAMTRLGLPPINPVFGEAGSPVHLAYYYLWHFSAAEIAVITSVGGWEADIGLTWFTAFASLSPTMGLAVRPSKRTTAAIWVVTFAAAGSLWVTFHWIFQAKSFAPVLLPSIGMGGWLFQATWVPQQMMAASCVVTTMLLITRYAMRQNVTLILTIALLLVAGFESSAFVGGITLAIGALIAAPIVLGATDPQRRQRFAGGLVLAGFGRRLSDRAVRARPTTSGTRPRRRQPRHCCALPCVRRTISGLAAPFAGYSGLLAHYPAGRTAGYFYRRRGRARCGATQRHAPFRKTCHRGFRLSRRRRSRHIMAFGLDARREQRSRPARGHPL